jgi:hypothetical protein
MRTVVPKAPMHKYTDRPLGRCIILRQPTTRIPIDSRAPSRSVCERHLVGVRGGRPRRIVLGADDVAAALGRANVNVSTTVAEHNPLDTEERGIHPLVRFSPHYYNTEAEIDRAVAAIAELASAAGRP